MALSKMTKVLIVSHRSEAAQLLEKLQHAGIIEILNAERAICSKEYPEMVTEARGDRQAENLADRLQTAIEFLKKNSTKKTSILAPRDIVNARQYQDTITSTEAISLLEKSENCLNTIEKLITEKTKAQSIIDSLSPWKAMDALLEDITPTENTTAFAGLIPEKNLPDVEAQLKDLNACVEQIDKADKKIVVVIACLKENTSEVQKALRANDFENANFENLTGKPADIIDQQLTNLKDIETKLKTNYDQAAELSQKLTDLGILFDHYTNKSLREQTEAKVPLTEHAVFYEGWVKQKDYKKLEAIVEPFEASSMNEMALVEGEEAPVELENKNFFINPFESITRLYGMPKRTEFDPTALLAPFFAIFFALCLTDAAYGIIIVIICAFILKKLQADKKLIWMLLLCSVVTIVAGALTGGWFGAGLEEFAKAKNITWLANGIDKMRVFDPLSNPMPFLKLSILLGYIQVMAGLLAGFIHNMRRKAFIPGFCDHFSWLLLINSIVVIFISTTGSIPPYCGTIAKLLVAVGAILIVSGSHREGGIGARIGMGLYNLTGAIFYVGDILSYLRLMALGLGTAGVAIAVNIIAKLLIDIPYVGFILAGIILIVGHLFNIAMSALGAFIHSLRLQFVEFFPKFLVGGGRQFEPLTKEYKHVYINED